MATPRSITLNYLDRLKEGLDDCLHYINRDIEPEMHKGITEESEAVVTTIKLINELEVE